jgi:hypothetical protein
MATYKKYSLSLIVTFFTTIGVSAKPILVVVSDIIGSAKFAGEVVITHYDGNGKIEFQSTEYKDTITSAICGGTLTNGYKFPYPKEENYWTENYPFIGDTVFIVINGYNRINIFGKRIGNDYRLWSPLMSGSIAIFEYERPIKKIDDDKLLNSGDSIESCRDGCLLPIAEAKTLIDKYRSDFAKKLIAVSVDKYIGQEVLYLFYNDTLRLFNALLWTDEPPGKLRSLMLTYSNGKSLEIRPLNSSEQPTQFDINRQFDLDKFKKLRIKEIKWME